MEVAVREVVDDLFLKRKLARLSLGEPPRVLDLFSGCGGISLGFQRAGFRIDANVEFDPHAARSHALNFHPHLKGQEFEAVASAKDITAVEPDEFAKLLKLGPTADAIDVLVGGPPCQAYARVGRAKLREIADHPHAFQIDPRKDLYLRYLEYVRAFKPVALLMENVPDILNQAGHNYGEEICEALADLGYATKYSLINSAFHGVPQMRDRVFIVGVRAELNARIRFPRATHHMELPPGYAGTRQVALKYVDLLGGGHFEQADLGDESLPFPVRAHEAIGDLPFIHGDSVRRGARRFGPESFVSYRKTNEISKFAELMRQWHGFEGKGGVDDHAIRALPRDGHIFAAMREGAEYPEAHRTAVALFEAKAKEQGLTPRMRAWSDLEAAMVPPYDPSKFPNRWWKLRRDFPVRTLMAHIGKDTYSHIHYDGEQARTISVREAARLQSFPDGFRFSGTMNPAFRQIGNAVPPLMAAAVATEVKAMLDETLALA